MTNTSFRSFPAAGRMASSVADLVALALIFGLLALLADGSRGMLGSLEALHQHTISLDPARLPEYAVRTTLRMLAALTLSLLFTQASTRSGTRPWPAASGCRRGRNFGAWKSPSRCHRSFGI